MFASSALDLSRCESLRTLTLQIHPTAPNWQVHGVWLLIATLSAESNTALESIEMRIWQTNTLANEGVWGFITPEVLQRVRAVLAPLARIGRFKRFAIVHGYGSGQPEEQDVLPQVLDRAFATHAPVPVDTRTNEAIPLDPGDDDL